MMDRDRAMQELSITINSVGWLHYIEPSLKQLLLSDQEMLNTPPDQRGDKSPSDDFLRGRISGIRGVLADFRKHIAEHALLRAQEAKFAKEDADAERSVGTIYGADAANPREE